MASRKAAQVYRRPAGTGDSWIGKYVREKYPEIAAEAEEAGRRAAQERGQKLQDGLNVYRAEQTRTKIAKLQERLAELTGSKETQPA